MPFKNPPSVTNASGEERTVGYEFEFTGLDMAASAELIKDIYGGSVKQISTFEYEIQGSTFGTFTLELDAQLLREKKYEKVLKSVGIDLKSFKNIETFEGHLKDIASSVVPFEIITPPIPISKMEHLNRLIDELRALNVKGTGSSMFYAFGMHINPEIPGKSVESLLNHLRAYVLLDPWIRKDSKINMSRRMTPYINEYRENYLELILNPVYKPNLEQFISDYFKFENSRNRPLDLLPVFMHLNSKHTKKLLKDTLTSSRPTYHYRLPNCSIEDPKWSLADEWNRWVYVEELAADHKSLEQYCKAYLKLKKETLVRFESKWIKFMNRWVNKHE